MILAGFAGRLNLMASILLVVLILVRTFEPVFADFTFVKFVLGLVAAIINVVGISFLVKFSPNIPYVMTLFPFVYEWYWVNGFKYWGSFSVFCWVVAAMFFVSTSIMMFVIFYSMYQERRARG